MSTFPSPEPRTPSPLRLPPTARDFEIQRLSLVQNISTRTIAEKHRISQTRVRQIIKRVCDWLAAALPAKTEAQQEQEARLAQHLAADQMRHQIEQLQIFWDATGDPKYLRQQTRVIAALSRLGTIPGSIDALAADATEGPEPTSPPPGDCSPSECYTLLTQPPEHPATGGERDDLLALLL